MEFLKLHFTHGLVNMGQNIKKPNYKRIYEDMIDMRFPEKMALCESILKKDDITFFDIIKINKLLFESPKKEKDIFNQMHKSYDEKTILKILNYQKKNKLTNTQVAYHFRLSRNSVARWKKIYQLK